eukprot:2742724-Pyramimonas_sp.AAC.1
MAQQEYAPFQGAAFRPGATGQVARQGQALKRPRPDPTLESPISIWRMGPTGPDQSVRSFSR